MTTQPRHAVRAWRGNHYPEGEINMETMDSKYLRDAHKRHNTPMPETRTAARTTDPDTSHEAAASVKDLTRKQDELLACFRHSAASVGLTDEEIRSLHRSLLKDRGWQEQSDSGLRTRRSELVALGKVVDTGKRRKLRSNRNSIVWKLASDA